MTSSDHVTNVLRRVLALSLAPIVGACSASIDTEGFEPVTCASGGRTAVFPLDTPGGADDYLELRQIEDVTSPAQTQGTPCATASDVAACQEQIATAADQVTTGFRVGDCADLCPQHILIVNSGDQVTVLASAEAVKDWLGPVDSPADAVLMAQLAGYDVPCNDPEEGGVKAVGSDYEVLGNKYMSQCPVERAKFRLKVNAQGAVRELESEVIESDSGGCIGRRPEGLTHQSGQGTTQAGAYFANVAHLEAASVDAFERLREELAFHGAPQELLDRADAAREDEVRHARVMRRVAERFGGMWKEPAVEHRAPRSLEEIAIENAAEGCVRETYGALVGMWQAQFARDRVVRRVMRRVARDEAAHASLAWAVDAWLLPQLSEEARARVEAARQHALAEISAEARQGYDPELVTIAGMPTVDAGQRLAQTFMQALPALAA
ncbi:hypothetical protein [Chondromyces crocatus]|uniref:Ferritin n=1 Tax=Chondromyces crocatus TaxID=52 RepID=A0A0K1E772_CHOCO|nr:hypothetical protein [Chondromyces crocatus]AKT36726.1 ferritin [Chondromyces crocatus]